MLYHFFTLLTAPTAFAVPTTLPQVALNKQPQESGSPDACVGQRPRAWWYGGTRTTVLTGVRACTFGGNPCWAQRLQKCLVVMFSLSYNTCRKPRQLCFLWEGEALPMVIKQPPGTHSTHKNGQTSLSPASQNTKASGPTWGFLWGGTTWCTLEAS